MLESRICLEIVLKNGHGIDAYIARFPRRDFSVQRNPIKRVKIKREQPGNIGLFPYLHHSLGQHAFIRAANRWSEDRSSSSFVSGIQRVGARLTDSKHVSSSAAR